MLRRRASRIKDFDRIVVVEGSTLSAVGSRNPRGISLAADNGSIINRGYRRSFASQIGFDRGLVELDGI